MDINVIITNSSVNAQVQEWARYGLAINSEVKRHENKIRELYGLVSVSFDDNETHRVVVDSRKLTTNIGEGLIDEINAHKYCISLLSELMYKIDDKINEISSQKKEEPEKKGIVSQVRSLLTKNGRNERNEVKSYEMLGKNEGISNACVDISSELDNVIFDFQFELDQIDTELCNMKYGTSEYMSFLAKHDQMLATLHKIEAIKHEYENKIEEIKREYHREIATMYDSMINNQSQPNNK